MTLYEEIQAKCPELVAGGNHLAIADAVNVGRVKVNSREIGNGTILETIGMTAGNALLDVINNAADFRYVKPLVEQGRLVVGAPLVQATLQSLVPAVLTQPQADALCALGYSPDPVDVNAVAQALEAGV